MLEKKRFRNSWLAQDLLRQTWGGLLMAYVITDSRTKDEHCIEACPVACIHPTKQEADFATV